MGIFLCILAALIVHDLLKIVVKAAVKTFFDKWAS
jgi:hypothetical protein